MSFDRDEMPNWVFLLWQKYSVIQKYFNISDSTFTHTILFVFPSGRPPYEEWEQFKVQLRHIFPMTMKNLDINIFQEIFQYSFWYFIIILWMGSTKWNGVDIELTGEVRLNTCFFLITFKFNFLNILTSYCG